MSVIQKLMLSFLALALGPVLLIAPLIYVSVSQTIEQQVGHQLESVATIQTNRTQTVVRRNGERLASLTQHPELAPAVDRLSRAASTTERERINQLLRITKSQADTYTGVVVADPAGSIIGATDPARLGQNVATLAAFKSGRQQMDVSNHFYTTPSGETGLYLTAPVQLQGRLVGVALIESSTTNLFAAIQDRSGLGSTGEVMVLRQDTAGNATYLAPLRFDAWAALKHQTSHTDTKSVVVKSVGQPAAALTKGTDYRDQKVLAIARSIEDTNWRLIVKMDQAEAYIPLAGLRDTFLILIFVILVISVFTALYVARSTIEPIIVLAQAADLMSKGDLSQRVPITSSDEFGSLATAFNNMAGGLEKMDQAKSEFITLMSHQLRTPATAVKGFMSMVLDGYAGKLSAKQTKLLQAAFQENERQMRIVDDILLVEAANANQMALTKTPTNLTTLVTSAVASQDGIFREHNQKITVTQPKGPLILPLDAEKIRMVIENLINNASKYSPDKTEIRVTVKRDPLGISISIADQGFGIAPTDISKLFQRFSRLPNPHTTQAQGSGLGLYLVKKIINLHEGEINVASEVGRGTVITIHLPHISSGQGAPAGQSSVMRSRAT